MDIRPLSITQRLTRKVWKQLSTGEVPIASHDDIISAPSWVDNINKRLKNHSYIPEVVHGYLGLEKQSGVTRFIPILTKEDMAIYYHLCGEIGDEVIEDRPNIFGGWRSIPTARNFFPPSPLNRNSPEIDEFQQNYYVSPFSNAAWFQQFRSFNEVIRDLVGKGNVGNYVIKTDIANFYDSIDIGRLMRKLRRDAPLLENHINLLEVFLGYWNRRTTGYQASSRGIPQEIISDGSRNLSHYYLQDFDRKFIEYCEEKEIQYVRWADDILVFGPSEKLLEAAIHNASRLLLQDGLNLNASKTRAFTRRDFEKYRGLKVLNTIEKNDQNGFQREIRAMQKWSLGNPIRLDTVFRASIGFASKLGNNISSFERNFIAETLEENPHFLGSLNTKQILRLVTISDDPKKTLQKTVDISLSKEITGPKANMLVLFRDYADSLKDLGITKRVLENHVKRIRNSSESSDVLNEFCISPAEKTIQGL